MVVSPRRCRRPRVNSSFCFQPRSKSLRNLPNVNRSLQAIDVNCTRCSSEENVERASNGPQVGVTPVFYMSRAWQVYPGSCVSTSTCNDAWARIGLSKVTGLWELGWQALGMLPYIMHLMASSERLPCPMFSSSWAATALNG